jgi:hypothetical protein
MRAGLVHGTTRWIEAQEARLRLRRPRNEGSRGSDHEGTQYQEGAKERLLLRPMACAPVVVDGQRGPALRFGDPRVQALLSVMVVFRLLPDGFTETSASTSHPCWASTRPS